MVQHSIENLIPPSRGSSPNPGLNSRSLAGLSPAEQWFYQWVHRMGLAASYPDVEQAKEVLETYLPERTRRYSCNIPDPESGESWLRLVLITGELLRLQLTPEDTPIIVAVHASASGWSDGFEKISTPEFSAVRRALGIDKHWMLILEDIADAAPSSDELINALRNQAIALSECGIVRIEV